MTPATAGLCLFLTGVLMALDVLVPAVVLTMEWRK